MKKYTTEEITKLLDEATPGEWYLAIPDGYVAEHGTEYEVGDHPEGHGIWIAHTQSKPVASFIAAAPTIIRQLLAEREAYREVAVRLRMEIFDRAKAPYLGFDDLAEGIDAEARRLIEGKDKPGMTGGRRK